MCEIRSHTWANFYYARYNKHSCAYRQEHQCRKMASLFLKSYEWQNNIQLLISSWSPLLVLSWFSVNSIYKPVIPIDSFGVKSLIKTWRESFKKEVEHMQMHFFSFCINESSPEGDSHLLDSCIFWTCAHFSTFENRRLRSNFKKVRNQLFRTIYSFFRIFARFWDFWKGTMSVTHLPTNLGRRTSFLGRKNLIAINTKIGIIFKRFFSVLKFYIISFNYIFSEKGFLMAN